MSAQQYYTQDKPQQGYVPIDPNAAGQQQGGAGGGGGGQYAMNQSQPYAAPSYPPPAAGPEKYQTQDPEYGGSGKWGDTAPFSQQTEQTGPRFRWKARLNDPIFLVLFVGNLIGWAVVSGLAIKTFVELNGLGGGVGGATQGGTGTSVTLD